MLVSLQSSVSVPSSCPNFLKTFLSKHYLVIYSSPKPQPQIQKCCSRKDIRNCQELCRSVSTLVGSKNSYGVLIKHSDGELGAVELRQSKKGLWQSVSFLIGAIWEPGTSCCHLSLIL